MLKWSTTSHPVKVLRRPMGLLTELFTLPWLLLQVVTPAWQRTRSCETMGNELESPGHRCKEFELALVSGWWIGCSTKTGRVELLQ